MQKVIDILKWTIGVLSVVLSVLSFMAGNEILKLREENSYLKNQVRYLKLSQEYKPILEKSEAVRSSQNNNTSFSRRLNEAVYVNCRRLENSGRIFQATVNENLLRSNNYVLKTIGAWQILNASGKIILADLDGSLNL